MHFKLQTYPGGVILSLVAATLFCPVIAHAEAIEIAAVKHEGEVNFEKEILPLLRKKCLACHNATEAESDLVLETPQSILKGGNEGPAVVAGKSGESLLLQLAAHQKDPVMPPEDNDVGAKPFTSQELGLLKLWIDQGAKGEVTGLAGPLNWQPLPAGVNPVYAVAISPNGQYVAAGRANQIFIYHLPSKREIGRLTDPALLESKLYDKPGVAHFDIVQSLAFSPDSRTLASGGFRTVKLWQRQPSQKLSDIQGIAGPAKSLATSPDGKLCAIGQENGEVKLVDLANNKVLQTIGGHAGHVTAVAFNKDASQLVSGSQDKSVRVWNTADGKQVGITIETPAEVNAIAFVSEGKQIATGHQDNKIRTWELPPAEAPEEPLKPVKEIAGHGGPIRVLQTMPGDDSQIASGSDDSTVRIWSASGGNQIRALSHGGQVTGLAIRPDGQRIVSISNNKIAKLWNAANGQQIAELRGDFEAANSVSELTRAVNLAKRHIDIAKKDLDEGNKRKTAEEANLKKAEETSKKADEDLKAKQEANKKPAADLEAAEKDLEAKKTALEAAEKAKTEAEEAFKLADEEYKKAEADRNGKEGDERAAADKVFEEKQKARTEKEQARNEANNDFNTKSNEFKQAENKLKQVTGPAQKAADELTAAERAMQAGKRGVERSKQSVQKATDAIPGFDAAVKSAEEHSTAVNQKLEEAKKAATESEQPLLAVAITPDGGDVVIGGDDKLLRFFDTETGAPSDRMAVETVAGQLAFGADGQIIVAASSGGVASWKRSLDWDLARTIGGHDSSDAFVDRVTALDFSNNGSLLATGGGEPSRGGEVKLWNVENGQLVREIADAHSDTVFGLDFSPDDSSLASSGADRFMKVFTVANGAFEKSFEGHTHHVLGVSWSADGMQLATSGADGVIKVWNYRTGDQARTIAGFKKEVTSVSFVADTVNVVAACGDRNVHMKRVDNGGNVRSFGGGGDFMYDAQATADGKQIVAGGQDSVVRVWLDNGQVFATFEAPKPEEPQESGE